MNRWPLLMLLFLAAVVLGPAAHAQARPPALNLPLACEPGRTCAIQSYMDHDPGPGARDYRCGARVYDKHSGVDIRILDLAAMKTGVPVLAAAPAKVLRLRDRVADISVRDRQGGLNGEDCGNGVVLDFGGGWQAQYCHMRLGSVRVKAGQDLATGDVIGLVGLSGNTEFPHLHVTVQHNGRNIDPFAYGQAEGACGGGTSLWTPATAAKLAYKASEVLNTGYAAGALDMAAVEAGQITPPTNTTPLVAYVRAIGLKAGDMQELVVTGPDGAVIARTAPAALPRDQAQRFIFVGGRPPPGGWKSGVYRAHYAVRRSGAVALERRFEIRL